MELSWESYVICCQSGARCLAKASPRRCPRSCLRVRMRKDLRDRGEGRAGRGHLGHRWKHGTFEEGYPEGPEGSQGTPSIGLRLCDKQVPPNSAFSPGSFWAPLNSRLGILVGIFRLGELTSCFTELCWATWDLAGFGTHWVRQ